MLRTVRRSRLMALLLLLLGPLAGAWTFFLARANEYARVEDEFVEHLAGRAASLEARMGSSVEMLQYLAALYESSEHVTRDEFAAFARPALARHPEIHAVEWAPRVEARERTEHVATMQAEGLAGYEITRRGADLRLVPAPAAAEYYPVAYTEPAAGNGSSQGFDVGSESLWRDALERAVATGRPQLTDPINLARERGCTSGVLVVLPINAPTNGVAHDPIRNLLGVLLLDWRADELITRELGPGSDTTLRDVRVDLQDVRDGGTWLPLVSVPDRRGAPNSLEFEATVAWALAGRQLRLTAAPSSGFSPNTVRGRPLLIGLVAFLFFGLLALGVWYRQASVQVTQEKSSLRLIRSLLRSLDQCVVVADTNGVLRLVNEATDRLVGGLPDAVARRVWTAVGVGPPTGGTGLDRRTEAGPLSRAVAGEHFEDEEIFVGTRSAPGGLWLRASGAPLRSASNEPLGGVVVFRDITKKRAQDARIRRLTAAVDQAADAIFVTDREGRILDVNQGFEGTSGFSRAEVLGRTPRILNSGMHDAEHFRRMWGTILQGNVYRGTTINRRKDGTLWHGEQSVTPIRDASRRLSHFVSVTKDITERMLLLEQEAEMRVAGLIQRRLYPEAPLDVAGLDVAFAAHPAAVTSGDYFDVIHLPDGTLSLAIGDVSGHGIGPALIMVETRAHLRSLLEAGNSIRRALMLLNDLLCDDLPDDRFVSLLLVHYDPRTRHLTHVNAGHPPGFVVGGLGARRHDLDPTGPALGLIPGWSYVVGETLALDVGDILMLLTDGITELHAPDGGLYACERLLQTISDHRRETATDIVAAVYASAEDFAAGRKTEDDLTLLVCKVVSEAGGGSDDAASWAPRAR